MAEAVHQDKYDAASEQRGHNGHEEHQHNGVPSESEFRMPSKAKDERKRIEDWGGPRRNEEQSSVASHETEHEKPYSGHSPSVREEEDPTSHEVRYTAEVGREASESGGKTLLMAASPQLAQDVRAAFAGVPRVKPQWSDRHLKIMVVGESGLGKTTFIKNLLAPYAQDPNLKVNDASGPEAVKIFSECPEKLATNVLVNDHNTLTSFHYSVQDTPGYHTLDTTKEPILEYIRSQNTDYIEREQDAKRNNPLTKFPDKRVDVVLFFIAPHRLRALDVDFIVDLARLVPVVPILAKADSMTVEELREFRRSVRQTLEEAGKKNKMDLMHAFSEEALDAAGARRDAPPFAVVSSTTMDLSVGRFWPVRKYPWGTCEALSSTHTDVGALKRLLFEEGYEELKAGTEERYYAFRSQQLLNLDDPTLPIRRGTLAEHLYRAVAKPKSGEQQKVRHALRKAVKYAVGGAVFYFAVGYALGGKQRLRQDFEILQEKGGEAAHWTAGKASEAADVISDKAGDVAQDVRGKAVEAKEIAARKGAEVQEKLADKAGEVKEKVAEKFMTEEELEQKRREEERKHRWGPFGIFRK